MPPIQGKSKHSQGASRTNYRNTLNSDSSDSDMELDHDEAYEGSPNLDVATNAEDVEPTDQIEMESEAEDDQNSTISSNNMLKVDDIAPDSPDGQPNSTLPRRGRKRKHEQEDPEVIPKRSRNTNKSTVATRKLTRKSTPKTHARSIQTECMDEEVISTPLPVTNNSMVQTQDNGQVTRRKFFRFLAVIAIIKIWKFILRR